MFGFCLFLPYFTTIHHLHMFYLNISLSPLFISSLLPCFTLFNTFLLSLTSPFIQSLSSFFIFYFPLICSHISSSFGICHWQFLLPLCSFSLSFSFLGCHCRWWWSSHPHACPTSYASSITVHELFLLFTRTTDAAHSNATTCKLYQL